MTELLNHLDELDRLVRTARSPPGIQSEEFISGLHDAMRKISKLLLGTTNHEFLNADSTLTEIIDAYAKQPTPLGVSEIGNALVSYRRTATS